LKGFAKVSLKPGEKRTVSVRLDHSAFAFYDSTQHAWVAAKGDYRIRVGGSSRDLKLDENFKLAETTVEK
jgi:beta-glucosidase